ncbi:MAG TPA: S8 family peptidase [Burkholderiaceae bacterium]|jgi:serine protease|nr:S8 family peptidase [Burkholderiaceae bacterium]
MTTPITVLRALVGCLLALPLLAAHAELPRPAHGLIVKLKDAPAHELAQSAAGAARAQSEQGRMRRVLAEAGVAADLGEARMRPSGRSAQLLRFARPLAAEEAQALAQRLRQRADVEWVVPNEREHRLALTTPNDPMFAATASSDGQWWLRPAGGSNANAIKDRMRGVPAIQSAWSINPGSASAVVAVLDTGITAHPDLNGGQLLPGYDFVSEVDYANDGGGRDADPSDPGDWVTSSEKASNPLFKDCDVTDSNWHGTIISGLIAAATNNGDGVAGINWSGRVLPVRVAGKCGATVSDIVDGMRWAGGLSVAGVADNPNPARVINISFGSSAACNAAYQSAIDELYAVGVVVVAAAGNEHTAVIRPASCNHVVAVAALNRDGFKASYSNFGPDVVVSTVGGDDSSGAWGDLLTDGGLLTLYNLGTTGPGAAGYARVFGTSFAAPVVAGTISLMLSVNANLTVDQIVAGLRLSARPHVTSTVIGQCSASNPGRCICTSTTCGAGILDAPQALAYAHNPTGYAPPTPTVTNIDAPEVVAAAARGPDIAQGSTNSSDSGGGGALDGWALLALAALTLLALLALRRRA